MLKQVDTLLKPVMDKLSKTDATKRKGAVLGMLGVSIFAVFGISLMLINTSDVSFLPETGTKTIVVGDPGDDNGSGCDYDSSTGLNCSLREAINLANANASLDTVEIRFGTNITKVTLQSTLPEITRQSAPVKIIGRDNPNDLVIYMERSN